MHCEEFADLISGHIDGTNSEREEALLQAHLQECDHCRALLDAYRSIDTMIAAEDAVPPADLKDQIMRAVQREPKRRVNRKQLFWGIGSGIAAAACLALIIITFPKLGLTAKEDGSAEVRDYALYTASGNTAPAEAATEAELFAPIPEATEKRQLSLPEPGTISGNYSYNFAEDTVDAAPLLIIWDATPADIAALSERTPLEALQPLKRFDDGASETLYERILRCIRGRKSRDPETQQDEPDQFAIYAYEVSFEEMNDLFTSYAGVYETAVYYSKDMSDESGCTVALVEVLDNADPADK